MNASLNQAIVDLIEKATSGTEQAIDFLSSELPAFVEQLLLWNFTYNLVCFVVAFIMILSFYPLLKKGFSFIPPKPEKGKSNWFWFPCRSSSTRFEITDGFGALYCVFLTFTSVVYLISILFFMNLEWLKIWLTPKVWLLEYASKLVN